MGQVYTTDTSWIHEECSPDEWNDGWSLDEWNDDWSRVGWYEGWEPTHDTLESSFSLAGLEWGKIGPEGIGDESFYDWIPDGEAWQTQGCDAQIPEWKNRSVAMHQHLHQHHHQELPCKEQQDDSVGHDGGYMIPTHSEIGLGMIIHFEKLLSEHGRNELIPVYLENDTPNFYLNRECERCRAVF